MGKRRAAICVEVRTRLVKHDKARIAIDPPGKAVFNIAEGWSQGVAANNPLPLGFAIRAVNKLRSLIAR